MLCNYSLKVRLFCKVFLAIRWLAEQLAALTLNIRCTAKSNGPVRLGVHTCVNHSNSSVAAWFDRLVFNVLLVVM